MSTQPTSAKPPHEGPTNDEPEVTQEESIPSDGKDEEGEKLMEDLGRERGGPGTVAPENGRS